jgi:hypothetical protein
MCRLPLEKGISKSTFGILIARCSKEYKK